MQVFTYPESKTYTLYNTFEHPVIGLKMWGNSVQDTSTGGEPAGKNLVSTIYADNNTTVNNGVITQETADNIANPYVAIQGVDSDGTLIPLGDGDNIKLGIVSVTFTVDREFGYMRFGFGGSAINTWCGFFGTHLEVGKTYTIQANFTNITQGTISWQDMQIELGSTATDYEPYIGKPTPNAPITIESVGDDGVVIITACGKNVFPWNDYTTAPFQPNTLTSWERTSDEISVVPDAAKVASGFCIWNSQVNKNFYACDGKTITISCELWAESETTLRIGIENIKLQKFTVGNAWQKCSVTLDFMLSTSGKTIAWYANYSDVPFKVRNIQVEIGSVATDYEPYKGNTATITSGLPLCSVGEYRDELIYNADGTGKIIKRIREVELNGNEEWSRQNTETENKYRFSVLFAEAAVHGSSNPHTMQSLVMSKFYPTINYSTAYVGGTQGVAIRHNTDGRFYVYDETYATATLDEWKAHLAENPLTVIYVLNIPQEIELSAAEMAALAELQTMDKTTNVFNSDNAEMQITFLGGQEMETNIDGFWDSEDGDRKYSAADFVGFFQDFFTNGIVAESTTYLQVRAKEGLTVRVNVGKAYINGGFFKPKTVTDLTIEDSDTTNPRYDMVVLRWDATIKKIYLDIVKGTPAATPSTPALTRNEIVYELGLARIYVAANTLQITQANITDLRFNTAYCGVVKGVIDTIDTTDLFAQYEKAWIDFVAQLGDSDHVEISTIDETARADVNALETIVAEHTATLKTNAPYKILTGSGTASGGSTSITFETAFKAVPVVIAVPYSTSTTAARACTCHLSAISATGFTVKTYTVTGATSANVANTGIGFRWVAFGT